MNLCLRLIVAVWLFAIGLPVSADQIDIPGPSGSGAFGNRVAVLPNGNIVVTDPNAASNVGAVYLYSSTGNLISAFTGGAVNDNVGSDGITVLPNGNFVISSSTWSNGTSANAGAVTWVNGGTGLSGMVSPANSLVGTAANDFVGNGGVAVLSNGNYVVNSYYWANGARADAGAVSWANGSTGLSGAVSAANSLVGTTAYDLVGIGRVISLSNGNYVVPISNWHNGGIANAGAVTWANGGTGLWGTVSAANSLVGTTTGDYVGNQGVTALSNSNYVVASSNWTNGATAQAGAVTWADGSTGLSGAVSTANSLVGTTTNDYVGNGGVAALRNGNYVVGSYRWANGAIAGVGAVTWADGSTGLSGVVSAANSLVGTTAYDYVGGGVTALSNGNYVVASSNWHNSATPNAGAVTWVYGSTGLSGVVSAANSLVGTTADDYVGIGGVNPLSNGNYVVRSNYWANGSATQAGAATWANGSTGLSGAVSAANSLVGTTASDNVGAVVIQLRNSNYVVGSYNWTNGATATPGVGAVTWADGGTGLSGVVSAANSLVGTTAGDHVGYGVAALRSSDNYVTWSPDWANGALAGVGAVTWANGGRGLSGAVSAANSLVGATQYDNVGSGGINRLSNGNYAIVSTVWTNGATGSAGAVSLGRGSSGLIGPILAMNSVRGTTAGGGSSLVLAYDATRDQLVVGQPASNIVSLFKADQLFASGFE